MGINNSLLKNSIDEQYKKFLEYYKLISRQCECLLNLYDDYKNKELFNEIEKNEALSDVFYRERLASIEWCLSKHTPVANNLRFFIATLLSIKDLERCSDYVYGIAVTLYKNEDQYQIHQLFGTKNLWLELIEHINKIWTILLLEEGKISESNFKKVGNIIDDFQKKFQSYTNKLNSHLINQLSSDLTSKNKDFVSKIFLISMKIDRMLGHIYNVADNFSSI